MTDRAQDVATVNWKQGDAFLINNPRVAAVRMTQPNGEITGEVIPEGMIPYAFHAPFLPTEYAVPDADGSEVR